MIYDGADRAIREMNRQNLKAFGLLKLMKADELHVIRRIKETYDASARRARTRYYEIAVEAYILAMIEAGKSNKDATKAADRDIDAAWVLAMLEEADPVTLYAFLPEKDRKAARLAEALEASPDKGKEIDKALRYWTVQVGQYAITAVDRARLEAFRRAGIKEVMWNTERDERVCEECEPRDGEVYPIDAVPPKPHLNCRCWLTPVTE